MRFECQPRTHINVCMVNTLASLTCRVPSVKLWFVDEEILYRTLGLRIRDARRRSVPRLSQQDLATRIGISRTSVVNIEAGRQHAPLHVVVGIAEALATDIAALIPRPEDILAPALRLPIDRKTMKEIERASGGNHEVRKLVTSFVQSLRGSADLSSADDEKV